MATEQEGHTALPWKALDPDEVDVFVPIVGVIIGENGEPLDTPTNGLVCGATLYPTEIDAEDYERAKANAAFIVRAANNHYDLLDAARRALNFIQNTEGEFGDSLPSGDALRAAIARATGEA
jgi:hypothetical protein